MELLDDADDGAPTAWVRALGAVAVAAPGGTGAGAHAARTMNSPARKRGVMSLRIGLLLSLNVAKLTTPTPLTKNGAKQEMLLLYAIGIRLLTWSSHKYRLIVGFVNGYMP